MRNKIIFYLNGKRHEVGAQEGSMMLADYLRYDQSLTGTKIVCAEGDCGACSVLRYFPHVQGADSENYIPVNSCITLVAQLDGSSLVTVDALKKDEKLHPAQESMVKCHGSQCGFCTPGFVMALTGLCEKKLSQKETTIDEVEAKNSLTGNLCRCTGYQPIIDAAVNIDLKECESIKKRFYSNEQEKDLNSAFAESLFVKSEEFAFFAPKTLSEALEYLKTHSDIRIIGSTTDLGVIHNKRKIKLTNILSLQLIEELYSQEQNGDKVKIGARVTLSEFRHFIKSRIPEFASYLDVFASPQIKNIATVVGNVANASPVGDTPSALLSLDASVCIIGPTGEREVDLSKFFLAYRKTALMPGEIITAIKFKLPNKNSTVRFFKNSNRKDLDISAVNFAIKIEWTDESKKEIEDITIAAGGVAAIPLRFYKTEEYLKKNLDIKGALQELHKEFNPLSDLRASSAYRHILIENYFKRAFSEVGIQ